MHRYILLPDPTYPPPVHPAAWATWAVSTPSTVLDPRQTSKWEEHFEIKKVDPSLMSRIVPLHPQESIEVIGTHIALRFPHVVSSPSIHRGWIIVPTVFFFFFLLPPLLFLLLCIAIILYLSLQARMPASLPASLPITYILCAFLHTVKSGRQFNPVSFV